MKDTMTVEKSDPARQGGTPPTKKPAGSPTARIGGYKDRPWIPRFWDGMTFPAWLKLLARARLRISPLRIGMSALIFPISAMNSSLGLLQTLVYGRKIARTRITQQPIFIVGHWRSGTTMLHEYLVLDQRHTFADTYACFAPQHHLLSRPLFAPLLSALLPAQRPMDNMAAGWDRPQEDEFALCNMGLPSPYLTCALPNTPQCREYIDMQGIPPEELQRWEQKLLWFLKTLSARNPQRIILKSPPHTGRIRVLLEMFPQARFLHIYRDPWAIFPSTINLWKRLYADQCLQKPRFEGLEDYVFETFNRMYAAFERDRPLIPAKHFAEVSYEQLVADPVGQMRRIYDELDLGGFDELRPVLEDFVAGQKNYQKNRFEMAPELRDEISRRWAAYIEKYGYGKR
jgi:hypothetical protein